MFLNNKYTKWYNSIILHAKGKNVNRLEYYERHHIVPRCMGGDNSKPNVVVLTAREHFICHLLLTKMVEGANIYKMTYAISRMCQSNTKQRRHKNISARTYQYIRSKLAVAFSVRMKKYWSNPDYRKQQSERQKLLNQDPLHRAKKVNKGEKNGMFGKKRPRDLIERMNKGSVAATKGKTYEQLHGQEKAQQLKQQRSLTMKHYKANNPPTGTNNANAKRYRFIDPRGVEYVVEGNLRVFCKQHKLEITAVIDTAKGRRSNYKGWKIQLIGNLHQT